MSDEISPRAIKKFAIIFWALALVIIIAYILSVQEEQARIERGERLSGHRFDSYCGNYMLRFLRSNEFRLESHGTFVMGSYTAYRNNTRVFMSIPQEFESMPTNFIAERDVMDLRIGTVNNYHLFIRRR